MIDIGCRQSVILYVRGTMRIQAWLECLPRISGEKKMGRLYEIGTRLYVEEDGKAEKSAVILIHGITLDVRVWSAQVAELREHFRVIRYDLRGFGRSDDPDLEWPYQNRVDLEALLDGLKIPTAYVVGLSRGGRVALEFAVRNPDRVRKLVLIGTALRFKEQPLSANDSTLPFIKEVGELLKKDEKTEALEHWLKAPIWQSAKGGVLPEIREIVSDYFNSKHEWDKTNRQTDLVRSGLSGIKIPILALVGEHDGDDFKESADFLRQHVPSCKHRIVPEAGHLANLDNASFVNGAIVAFLTEARTS